MTGVLNEHFFITARLVNDKINLKHGWSLHLSEGASGIMNELASYPGHTLTKNNGLLSAICIHACAR